MFSFKNDPRIISLLKSDLSENLSFFLRGNDLEYPGLLPYTELQAALDEAYAALTHNHDTVYAEIDHNHDDRYYTEDELDILFEGKTYQYILIYDKKSQGTDGGTFTAGARRTRDLSDIIIDETGLVILSNNQITLPSGSYFVRASAPAFKIARHRAYFKGINPTGIDLLGTSEVSTSNSITATSRSWIQGKFIISESTIFEVQHQSNYTCADFGFGLAMDFSGEEEIYSCVELWRKL
jgi:hypothetical protein